MNYRDKHYWFPARKSGGWGWGVANNWQGALIQVGYPALAFLDFYYLRYRPAVAIWTFVALTVGFLAIHWIKGEPPSWHW